jgi:hypothetical protein
MYPQAACAGGNRASCPECHRRARGQRTPATGYRHARSHVQAQGSGRWTPRKPDRPGVASTLTAGEPRLSCFLFYRDPYDAAITARCARQVGPCTT